MSTITLELPAHIDLSEHDAKMIFAAKLYEEGILSSGQAAEMVGITKREFIETVGKYGVSIFGDLTEEELLRDLEVLNRVVDTEVVKRRMAEANRHG